MIKFERYMHVNDFISHYLPLLGDIKIESIIKNGVNSKEDAELFSSFVLKMVDKIHLDAEEETPVLGSKDNTDILLDISYEVTGYMRKQGYFAVWEKLFDSEDE